ncbi:hypothetical protein J7T55_010019 [Diaporthe amygdali]|uniref:uncharacterized protein n=1 Tax=Phomopsis amygdali TaxID=1214568 RepID=UPI0022FF30C1|nr:uncharacterized protein J7T55_010019 [Diaporthe amygdali]KAJ0116868.1 hypothetical protein J7T55_010019 [Diaporthe amygdali]
MALDTRNHFDRLPAELFSMVTEQSGLSVSSLAALALTSRRSYKMTIPIVYKKHVQEEFGSAIYWAIQNEQYSTLDRLIEHGVDINLDLGEDEDHISEWTALHYAICNGHGSTAKLLLARGASTRDVGGGGVTALHTAARQGMESIIDHLIDNKLVDINAGDVDGITALHVSYRAGNFSIVDNLLDSGADINLAFYSPDTGEGPWTIFAMACSEDRLDKALEYLRRGADPGFVIDANSGVWSAMRLIYAHRESRSPDPTFSEQQLRLTLEQEIFKAKGAKPPALL